MELDPTQSALLPPNFAGKVYKVVNTFVDHYEIEDRKGFFWNVPFYLASKHHPRVRHNRI